MTPYTEAQSKEMLKKLEGWALEGGMLARTYEFKNYYETMAFVNALAWISHRQDHHPDIGLGYNKCKVIYVTHSVGGLSEIGAPITWVTASVAYKLTDSIGVSLEGRNLTDAHYFADLGRRDILAGFETWGRSVILGVNVKF